MPSHVQHLARTTRSFRRFRENFPVTRDLMTQWVDNARVTASRCNLQPLKYHLVTDKQECAQVFSTCVWARYLSDWDGPKEGERPTGYIILCNDTTLSPSNLSHFDAGIAAQTIMLASVEEGFGGCMIGSFHAQNIREILNLDKSYVPMLVVAIGEPQEKIVLEDVEPEESTNYYRDEQDVHYVPKRKLKDIVFTAEKK